MKYVAIVIRDCMNASLVMVNAVNSVPLSIINLNNNFFEPTEKLIMT